VDIIYRTTFKMKDEKLSVGLPLKIHRAFLFMFVCVYQKLKYCVLEERYLLRSVVRNQFYQQ